METNALITKVIKLCYAVQQELGHGFNEKIYENALKILLDENDVSSQTQAPFTVSFHGHTIGEFFADVFVEQSLILELKAVKDLCSEHKSQVLNYLKASNAPTGLLINFGTPKPQIVRLYNNHAKVS